MERLVIHVSPTYSQLRPRLPLLSLRWLLKLLRRVARLPLDESVRYLAIRHQISDSIQNSGRSRPEVSSTVSRVFDTFSECRSGSINAQTPAKALRGAYMKCSHCSDLSILAGGDV